MQGRRQAERDRQKIAAIPASASIGRRRRGMGTVNICCTDTQVSGMTNSGSTPARNFEIGSKYYWLGFVDNVRRGNFAKLASKIWRELHNEDGQRILHNIRLLRERFEPETLPTERTALTRQRLGEEFIEREEPKHFRRQR